MGVQDSQSARARGAPDAGLALAANDLCGGGFRYSHEGFHFRVIYRCNFAT